MREIKFRAWQTVTKVMFYNIERGTGETGGNPPFADYLENKHMIVMQFTGWHDHNGKEVYEGDVIQFPSLHVGVVVWDTPNDGWRIRVHQTMLLRDNEMHVVGNIYENPNIIKDDLEWRRRSYNEVVNN